MSGYLRTFYAFILAISIVTPVFAGVVNLPQTGQTDSYGPGDDGAIQAGVAWPDPRMVDNGDGTVTDNLTGLMWLKDGYCVIDSGYGDGSIQWPQAFDFVDKLNSNAFSNISGYTAHYNDWRVPNINEMESLLRADSAEYGWLNNNHFQNVMSGDYLSSTTAAGNAGANTWFIYSYCGRVSQQAKTGAGIQYLLLPVRGNSAKSGAPAQVWQTGQTMTYTAGDDGNLRAGVAWAPDTRFKDNGNGTVTDNLTGLMWTKSASSQGYNWPGALSNISSFNSTNYLGHSDWRLPNRKEIRSLVDYSQANPALPAGNPFEVPDQDYWTSSNDPVHHMPDALYLSDGTVWNVDGAKELLLVWPVRGGITNGVPQYILIVNKSGDGTGQVTSSPSGIDCGASCTATQYLFNPNTVVTLTATASSGSIFNGWSGDATDSSGSVNITMSSNKSVTAAFGKSSYTLATAVSPASVGTVTLSTKGPYSPGTQVTLTANPIPGYQFSGWSGDASGTQNPLTVTMDKDMSITVNFTELPDLLSMYYDQSGKTVTFNASLLMNGSMVPKQKVQFFETVPGKNILRCYAVTGTNGNCQKKMSFQAGTHTWFAKCGQEVSAPVSCTIGAVTALSPANNAVVTTPAPDLSWQAYDNATGYEVQVSKSASFPAAYTATYDVSGTDFSGETPLLPGQRIYWRVTAVLPTGTSMPSATGSVVYKVATNLSLSLISVINNKGTFQATLTDADGNGLTGKRVKISGKYSASGVTGAGGVLVKTVTLPVGPYSVEAVFAGDATYAPSVSPPVSGTNP